MKIECKFNYSVEVEECSIDYLTSWFKQIQEMFFSDFAKITLLQFGDNAMKKATKPFCCSCGNNKDFIWKTRDAKPMKITTIRGEIELPQMQVQYKGSVSHNTSQICQDFYDAADRCKSRAQAAL